MYRFLTTLLILAVLAGNLAWAADECLVPVPGEAPVLVQADDDRGAGACDDFCAGWLHLQSIAAPTAVPLCLEPRRPAVDRGVRPFRSRVAEPPQHPPQA